MGSNARSTMQDLHDLVREASLDLFVHEIPPRFQSAGSFRDSQRVVLADKSGELEYVEGYVSDLMLPRAWVVIHGKVVDVTSFDGHQNRKRILGAPLPCLYLGVRFDRDFLNRARPGGESLIDNWKEHGPLLRDPSRAWRTRQRT